MVIRKAANERRCESLEYLEMISFIFSLSSSVDITKYVVIVKLISETETFMSLAKDGRAGR